MVYTNQFILFLEMISFCCGGCVNQVDLPHQTKNPILLPEKHHFSELVIKEKHMVVYHNGIQYTLAATQEDLKAHKLVKRMIRHCVSCRRFEGKPYDTH